MEVTDKSQLHESTRVLQLMRTALLKRFNSMVATILEIYPVSGLHMESIKKYERPQLNVMLMSGRLREMPEVKDYRCLNIAIPFLSAFLDRYIGISGRTC